MDLDLKSFSLTLAIGLTVATIVYFTLTLVQPRRAAALLDMVRKPDGEPQVLSVVVGSVLLLAIGIVCEDLSKNALSQRRPAALVTQLLAIMPPELSQRCEALIEEMNGDPFQCDWRLGENHPVKLSTLGYSVWNVLCHVVAAEVANPEEARVFAQIAPLLSQNPCATQPMPPSGIVTASYDKRLRSASGDFYYMAKNTVYENGEFMKELESVRDRFDFERSVVFVLLAGIYFASFAYLADSTVAMWRDVGGWKTGVSIVLGSILLVAAVDVLVKPTPAALAALCKEDSACAYGRNWLLPASVLFVCAYRTRRVWKDIARWLRQSIISTVPDTPLLQSAREQQAVRVLTLIATLAITLVPANLAYRADQVNYLNRVFGYYRTLRGSVVTCDAELACTATKTSKGDTPEAAK